MNKREWMLQAALVWIKAGHGGTSDDVTSVLSGTYDAIIAATPETAQDGAWVEYDGDVSKAPSPEHRVEVTFRDGKQSGGYGDDFSWDHGGHFEDVVRWRYA